MSTGLDSSGVTTLKETTSASETWRLRPAGALVVRVEGVLRVEAGGVAGHPRVEEPGGRGAVLDGEVREGRRGVRQVVGAARLPRRRWRRLPRRRRRRPPQLGVEAAVVERLEEQTQQVDEGQRHHQRQGVRLRLDRVAVAPPGGQQDGPVGGHEGVVDHAAAPGPPLRHVEPAEVPDEPHGGPVETLAADAVHEVRALAPGPQREHDPQRQEVEGGGVAGQRRGEQGDGRHARRDQQQVPQEVDEAGAAALLRLVRQEGAQRAVVVHHHPGDGGGGGGDAHDCKTHNKGVTASAPRRRGGGGRSTHTARPGPERLDEPQHAEVVRQVDGVLGAALLPPPDPEALADGGDVPAWRGEESRRGVCSGGVRVYLHRKPSCSTCSAQESFTRSRKNTERPSVRARNPGSSRSYVNQNQLNVWTTAEDRTMRPTSTPNQTRSPRL
ncbi:hypothetical protein EYF80_045344 [Liparis tanakae]|uniref:Uncharacterized protein n=1 Tax=Liparis tanakae TaxID=230148 RepID=A0A4Z2FTA9_9TELE|nr:hypothetical protein EYF80_045344 [Liparis tanakae]